MTRTSASVRLKRVLAILPWVISHGPRGASIQETCDRFGLSRSELTADLERVWMVGLYPYTPDRMIDVAIDGDRVSVRLAEYFSRPLRLTPAEGLALVATARSLSVVPGADPAGPLARGADKLARSLGVGADQLAVDLGSAPPETVAALRSAVEQRRRIRIDYYVYGRDEHSIRVVDPLVLHSERGSWYLTGHDHVRSEQRVFRVDRIDSLLVLDETFELDDAPSEIEPSATTWTTGRDDLPRVVLGIDPEAAWVLDEHPVEDVQLLDDGTYRATFAVAGSSWLERLLLQLGPAARQVTVPPELEGAAPRAATRVLERYGRRRADG